LVAFTTTITDRKATRAVSVISSPAEEACVCTLPVKMSGGSVVSERGSGMEGEGDRVKPGSSTLRVSEGASDADSVRFSVSVEVWPVGTIGC
jgi:hypothetical protein